jgi:hypothetical protein
MVEYAAASWMPRAGRSGPGLLDWYPIDLRARASAIDRFPLSIKFRRAPGGMPLRRGVFRVTEAALGYWQLRLDGAASDSQLLLMADWLVTHSAAGPDHRGWAWYSWEVYPRYGLGAGWPSARAQGLAISALLRAYAVSGSERYLSGAAEAVAPMTVSVENGGLARRVEGRLVLETYPGDEPVAYLVGWLQALVGLRELVEATGDARARDLLAESAAGLVALLERYDRGSWSSASLYEGGAGDPATLPEHRVATILLEGLAAIGLADGLRAAAERWRTMETPRAVARAALLQIRGRD